MRKEYKKALATGLALAVALSGISVFPAGSTSKAADEGYNLYFGVQTNTSWVFRNQWNDATYGGGSEAFEGGLFDTEDCKWAQTASEGSVTGYEWTLAPEDNKGAGHVPAIVTDALNVDLSGEEKTYTITCEADPTVGYLDWGDTGASHEGDDLAKHPNAFNTVFVSSNIPTEMVNVLDCKLYFDDQLVNQDGLFATQFDSTELGVDILNNWNEVLNPNNNAAYEMPKQSIKIEITIQGVGTSTPAPGTSSSPAPGTSNSPAPGTSSSPAPGTNVSPAPNTTAPGANVTPAPNGDNKPNTSDTAKPAKVKLSKVKSTKKKTLLVQWKKAKNAAGYQVQIAKDKKFKKGKKTYTVKGAKKTKTTIKKLKRKQKYFVRVRAYNKAKKYGKYSSVKSVKVK